MKSIAKACGKIILSGEYAVVFGYPGIALPSSLKLTATFEESSTRKLDVVWNQEHNAAWDAYLRRIIDLCHSERGGVLTIENELPLGKGMGSSTALVIAVTRALLGEDCRDIALAIEDTVNPGHSGLDFAVIFANRPLLFQKGYEPTFIDGNSGKPPSRAKGAFFSLTAKRNGKKLPPSASGFSEVPDVSIHQWIERSTLIDTGQPKETTAELVAWVKERRNEPNVRTALETIGHCTERLLAGEDACRVIRDHHRAQVALGVVPPHTQELIKKIEQSGGAAKVIGAGSRTGGSGIVLTLGIMNGALTPPCNIISS